MNPFRQNQTYYDILEISGVAAQHEITEAYRKAKATYSPDSPALYTMFSPGEAAELLKLIEEAYITLSNRVSRQEYDRKLTLHNQESNQSMNTLPEFDIAVENHGSSDPHPLGHMASSHIEEPTTLATPPAMELPDGFAKTKFSTYEIDSEIEKEIVEGVHFDGTFLQKLRLYKGVNLEQMSQETKISRPYLVALESNDYEALPARVFVRGFVVQICKALGIGGEKIATSYINTLKSSQP